jgi:hypothetical protein
MPRRSIRIAPRPGFEWAAVNWGGPDEPRTKHCSYCGDAIPEKSVPLMLWNAAGWCAEFCDHCQATWWGVESFDDADPRPEPEARRKY